MGQASFLARVLRIFLTTQDDFVPRFTALLADSKDPEAARRAAHTLKGAAASIGAETVRAQALALEAACRDGLPEAQLRQTLALLADELSPVLEGIRAALDVGQPGS